MSTPEAVVANEPAAERRDSSSENQFRRSIFGVSVSASVSVGQVSLSVAEILDLEAESIVPLMSKIDDPLELKIDNKVIARGDLVELDDGALAFKITEIPEEADQEENDSR